MSQSAHPNVRAWSNAFLALLALWAVLAAVAEFVGLTADGAAAARWLGAWRTLFAVAATVAGARILVVWVLADLGDRRRKRRHHEETALRRAREARPVPPDLGRDL